MHVVQSGGTTGSYRPNQTFSHPLTKCSRLVLRWLRKTPTDDLGQPLLNPTDCTKSKTPQSSSITNGFIRIISWLTKHNASCEVAMFSHNVTLGRER